MSKMVRFEMYMSETEHATFEHEALEAGLPNIASWMRGACNERLRKHEAVLPHSADSLRPVRFEMRIGNEEKHAEYLAAVEKEERSGLAEWVRDVCNAKARRSARRTGTG
jgi:hypothetical protein